MKNHVIKKAFLNNFTNNLEGKTGINQNLNLQSHPDESIEETLMRDLKPIILISRLFGIAPYLINKKNLTLSKIVIAYSILCIFLQSYVQCRRLYFFAQENLEDVKMNILFITMTVLILISINSDAITYIYLDSKLQNYLNYIRLFDKAMNYKNTRKFSSRTYSWILIFITGILAIALIIFASLSEKASAIDILSVPFIYATFTLGFFKCFIIIRILFTRFQHLNRMLIKGLYSHLMITNKKGFDN